MPYDEAEDVLQRVFFEVWRSRDRFDPGRTASRRGSSPSPAGGPSTTCAARTTSRPAPPQAHPWRDRPLQPAESRPGRPGGGGRQMTLRTQDLPAPGPGQFYEVWPLDPGTGTMFPVGVLAPNGQAHSTHSLLRGRDA